MPGYLVHLASCYPPALDNPPFRIGVEAPDLLGKYYRLYGLEGAKEKWESLPISNLPPFERFALRIEQFPKEGTTDGLHFGTSSNPDILAFWQSLSVSEQTSSFWRGYLWHLFTDKLFYQRLNVEPLISASISTAKDYQKAKKQEVELLHKDWDRTNAKILTLYPQIQIPPEIQELDIIRFDDEKDLKYVNASILFKTIAYLRSFDPLTGGIMDTIFQLLQE